MEDEENTNGYDNFEGGPYEHMDDPSCYCRHGTFIGSWAGPDYMCMKCELGDDDEELVGDDTSLNYNQDGVLGWPEDEDMANTITIFKYLIHPSRSVVPVEAPEEAQFMHVAEQGGQLYVWAIVNPDLPTRTYSFYVIGTGWNLLDVIGADLLRFLKYVGTVNTSIGFVWHVFADED